MSKKTFIENTNRWTEMPIPSGGRAKVEDLLKLEGEELLDTYMSYGEAWSEEKRWEHEKYGKLFKGLDVIEVGSGFGFDGLMYSLTAETYTFLDINPRQLEFLKKLVSTISRFQSPISNIKYKLLKDPLNQSFETKYSALYSHGVLHHIPLDFARKEFANFDRHLKTGSPVVLLMYPKERWIDCGRPSFEKFGDFTDGGCPWAEYYDEEKIMSLVGPNYELQDTIPWGRDNKEFINFELVKTK